jgi:malate dehydrogenase
MSKISFIGAGNVGSQAAFYSGVKELGEIVLIDIAEGIAKGKALDMQQSMTTINKNVKIVGGQDYSLTKDSDVVVITAGIARKPGMSRDDLLATNKRIISGVVKEVVAQSPNSILIIVTNPLDAMVKVAYDVSGFPKQKVIGMAGVLDTSRLRTFIGFETGEKPEDIQAMVLGGHGDQMVPIISKCTVKGKPISEVLPQEKIAEIIKRTQDGGAEVVSYLKTGSAFFAPGISIVEMIESILLDQKKTLPCSVLLEGEYGQENLFAGVPVILGKEGFEKVVELNLSEEEKKGFEKSCEHVKELMELIRDVS